MAKSTINGPCSIAMLNYQGVVNYVYIYIYTYNRLHVLNIGQDIS